MGYDMMQNEYSAAADKMVMYAEIARLEGILALEDYLNIEHDEFIREGLRLLLIGSSAKQIKKTLGGLSKKGNLPSSRLFYKLIIRACAHIAQGQNPKIVERDLNAMIEAEEERGNIFVELWRVFLGIFN